MQSKRIPTRLDEATILSRCDQYWKRGAYEIRLNGETHIMVIKF